MYAPVPAGQAKALRRAYEGAGYAPATVELMEAHGTGTKAGDVAEFEGLRQVFANGEAERRQWCALGSVKSQIGHTKAAAGAAGLFKAVMALHHKVLPPTIKVAAPNPKLGIERSPFYLNTEDATVDSWQRSSTPRLGQCVRLRRLQLPCDARGICRRRRACRTSPDTRSERSRPCLASDTKVKALLRADRRDRSHRRLPTWRRIARTHSRVRMGREQRCASRRLALVASTVDDLRSRLNAVRARIAAQPENPFELPDGSAYGVGARDRQVAFLFPGQGSQYLGMGAAIAMAVRCCAKRLGRRRRSRHGWTAVARSDVSAACV